jgi:hypothetical protein
MASEVARELRCGTCDCVIECCAFCDDEHCPKAVCYSCLIVAIGEAIPEPHTHGG